MHWILEAAIPLSIALVGFAVRIAVLKNKFTRPMQAYVGILLMMVVGSGIFIARDHEEHQRGLMREDVEVIRNVARVNFVIARAEAGQRGFLLTEDEDYLTAFLKAQVAIKQEIETLDARLSQYPSLNGSSRQLDQLTSDKFQEMASTITAYRQDGRLAGLGIVRTNKGLHLTSAIQGVSDQITDEFRNKITEATEKDRTLKLITDAGSISLLVTSLFVLTATLLGAHKTNVEQRKVSMALRDQHHMFDLASEAANMGHWTIDLPTRHVHWSDMVAHIHGFPPKQQSKSLDEAIAFYVPEDRARVATHVQHAIDTTAAFQFEARLQRMDGSVVEVVARGMCGRGEDGSVQSVFGILMDITALRTSERSVASSERLYRLLAENATDVIIKYDAEYRFVFVSPSSAKLLGREPDDMIGAMMGDFIHADDRAFAIERLKALDTGAIAEGAGFHYRMRHRTGEWVWVEASSSTFIDPHTGATGSIAIVRDFRQRKDVEDSLKASRETAEIALEEAVQANRAKTEFLASMSHEIRTPLNSIIGFTDLMLDDPALSGSLRYKTEVVRSSGTALLTIINDILDFSKIEAGEIDIEHLPFAPRALFANALSIVRGSALDKNVAITCNIDAQLPDVLMGDQARIQQILLNLLNNAVKFTPHGSVTLKVSQEKRTSDGLKLRVSVIDTGVGIPKHKQDRLFKRFSQADETISRQFGGTGLGLAICKRLIELMGGEIGVFSEDGQGSNFWFTLTLTQASQAITVAKHEAAIASRSGHVLLVEDIYVNQLLARTLLEADGHSVEVASSGEEAITAVTTRRFDVVLMDVQMSGMGGIEAARVIKRLPGLATLPIVALTANVLADQVSLFRDAGMVDHIGKPINRVELQAAVAHWLNRTDVDRSSEGGFFDQAAYDTIIALLGPANTRDMLRTFHAELVARFMQADLGHRKHFERDAHVVTAIAGTTGFNGLARRCADLLGFESHEEASFLDTARDIQDLKAGTLAKLDDLLAAALSDITPLASAENVLPFGRVH